MGSSEAPLPMSYARYLIRRDGSLDSGMSLHCSGRTGGVCSDNGSSLNAMADGDSPGHALIRMADEHRPQSLPVPPPGSWISAPPASRSPSARRLVTGVLKRVGALPLRALALLAVLRRQFNLLRWTSSQEFRDLHRTSVAWLDSHFELIERGAPWLHRVGRDVRDFCSGQVRGLILDFTPHFKASVACAREVTAVYGFDGPQIARLRSLDQAMPAAGWKMGALAAGQAWADLGGTASTEGTAKDKTRWMTDRQVTLTWQLTAAVGLPPGGERMRPWGHPPLAPRMRVTWSSRGQETGSHQDPGKTRGATRNYLPLEVSESGVPELLEQALARHEHALTVTIKLSYYSNPEARAWQHRVPRYILPTRPRRYRP